MNLSKASLWLVLWYPFGFAAAGAPIPGLFNSGVDDTGTVLPDRATDPHYIFSLNPDSASTNVIVHDSTVFPIVAGPWMPNNSLSKWVGPLPDTGGAAGGTYIYRLTFDLTGLDYNTARIAGKWTSDNQGVDILINGQSTGQSHGGD